MLCTPHYFMSTPETHKPSPKFIAPEKDAPLSNGFNSTHFKIFGAIAVLLVISLGYKFFSKPNVRLLTPTNGQTLGADELDFKWQSNKSKVSYVIEVYDREDGELVMRQITEEIGYKPDRYQQSFFQANHSYYWMVMSNPDINQSYNFKTDSLGFTINKSVEAPNIPTSIPADQQTPAQQTPTPTPQPKEEQPAPLLDKQYY